MDIKKIKEAFKAGAEELMEQADYFSSVDAETGDGDHGVTIAHIAEAIINYTDVSSAAGVIDYFSDLNMEILAINGGSIVPLWACAFDGISRVIKDDDEFSGALVYNMLSGALDGMSDVSGAAAGEKTIVDALYPAMQTAEQNKGEADGKAVLVKAAQAAKAGAESTKEMCAKYGRAKNLPDKGVGHYDPGALSAACFIESIAENV